MIYVIIISGVITSYFIWRAAFRATGEVYTGNERYMAILMSLLSWLGFLAGLVFYFAVIASNSDKPVKW